MMQMTDFTRGTGPLKNTSDVIDSAKKIASLGNDLDALASQIAEVSLDEFSKFWRLNICKLFFWACFEGILWYKTENTFSQTIPGPRMMNGIS